MQSRLLALAVVVGSVSLAVPALGADTESGAYHIYRSTLRLVPPKQGPATMQYFGGPVIGTVKLAVVIWGNGVPKITATRIGPFASAIVDSSYIDQLGQYSTIAKAINGRQGTGQTIARGSYLGQFKIAPTEKDKALTDKAIEQELASQIASGALPPADVDTLYMLYFPPGVSITVDGMASCSAFAAYHAAVPAQVSPADVFYAAIPDCGGGFSGITHASSHEFAASVTDAIPTPGAHPKYPQAWMRGDGYEIGDVCNGDETTMTAAGKTYVVAQLFDNRTNACGTGKFTSP